MFQKPNIPSAATESDENKNMEKIFDSLQSDLENQKYLSIKKLRGSTNPAICSNPRRGGYKITSSYRNDFNNTRNDNFIKGRGKNFERGGYGCGNLRGKDGFESFNNNDSSRSPKILDNFESSKNNTELNYYSRGKSFSGYFLLFIFKVK